MIDALFSQSNYLAAKKMLDATVLRQEAISSNLSNLETPGYKRLDVAPSFATQLKDAVLAGSGADIASARPELAVDSTAISQRRDGNTVELEKELLRMSQTALEHSLETQLVTGNLLRLRLAISGRP